MGHPELSEQKPPRPRAANGHFARGQPAPNPGARRKRGIANKLTRDIKHGITEAAILHGSDGKGKDGLVGFFSFLLLNDLRAFSNLLGRLIPFQVSGVPEGGTVNVTISPVPSGHFLPLEEARALSGYAPGGVLTMTPGIKIGEAPSPPKLVVIENDPAEAPPPPPK